MKPYYDTDKHGYCKKRCCKRGRRFRNAMYPKGTARVLAEKEIETQVKDHESFCDFYGHYKEVEGYYVEEDWWQWWRQHVA